MNATAIYDGNYAKPSPTGAPRYSAPFAGDNNYYLMEIDFLQFTDRWKPGILSELLNGFYLVEESPLQSVGAGISRWTRTFAKIPGRRIDFESYAWRIPGLTTDANPFGVGISTGINNNDSTTTIVTVANHNLSVGDNVNISYNVKFANDSAETTHTVLRQVLAVGSPTSFTVSLITEAVTFWQSVRNIGSGRDPITKVVNSKIEFEYFLCGAKGSQYASPEQISILLPDVIVDSTGKETESYSPTTTPDLASFQAKIKNQSWIVPEASSLKRWKGNIYERTTRFVRAQ